MGRKTKARKSVNKENETQPNIAQALKLDSKPDCAVEAVCPAQVTLQPQKQPLEQPQVLETPEIAETVPEELVQWAVQFFLTTALQQMVCNEEKQPEVPEETQTAVDDLVQRSLQKAMQKHVDQETLHSEPAVLVPVAPMPHVPLSELDRVDTDVETVLHESLLATPVADRSFSSRISQCVGFFRRCW
jgi:hypothetical protein